jgi:hypothetical protein
MVSSRKLSLPPRYSGSGVYIIRSGAYSKIGYSKNIHRRFQSIQVGNPNNLDLLLYIPTDVKYCKELESQLHCMFKSKLFRGEWYELDESDLEYIEEYFTVIQWSHIWI